jgi:hypothetical protein
MHFDDLGALCVGLFFGLLSLPFLPAALSVAGHILVMITGGVLTKVATHYAGQWLERKKARRKHDRTR